MFIKVLSTTAMLAFAVLAWTAIAIAVIALIGTIGVPVTLVIVGVVALIRLGMVYDGWGGE